MTTQQYDTHNNINRRAITTCYVTEVSTIWQAFTIHYDVMNPHVDRELCRAKNANDQQIKHAERARRDKEHNK